MRTLICFTIVFGLWASICSAQCKPDSALVAKSDIILKDLSSLSQGINVVHNPDKVKARPWDNERYKFQWVFSTNVEARAGSVKILEFGCFYWSEDRWIFANYTGEPFSAKDFSEWYSCPGAELLAGHSYVDLHNWIGAGFLRAEKMMWYYIGIDEEGRRVKGESVVEELAELLDD